MHILQFVKNSVSAGQAKATEGRPTRFIMNRSMFDQAGQEDAGPAGAEHLPFAFWAIEEMRPKVVLEVGAGGLFRAAPRVAAGLGLTTRFIVYPGAGGSPAAGAVTDAEILARPGGLAQSSVDLLHIDAVSLLQDPNPSLEAWTAKLADGALLLVSGVAALGNTRSVAALLDRLRTERSAFEFPHAGGLLAVSFGGKLCEGLRRLFDAARAPGVAAEIRDIFASLGRACANNAVLDSVRQSERAAELEKERALEEVKTLQGALAAAKKENEALQLANARETKRFEDRLKAAMDNYLKARAEYEQADKQSKEMTADLERRFSEIAVLTQMLMEADKLVGDLRKRLDDFECAAEARQVEKAELHAVQHAAENLQAEKAEMAEHIRRLEQEAEELRATPSHEVELMLTKIMARNISNILNCIYGRPLNEIEPPIVSLVMNSVGLVDPAWYLKTYPDVAEAGLDPGFHFLLHGVWEGRLAREGSYLADIAQASQ